MWMRMYPLDPPFRFAVLVATSRSGPSHHRKVWHRFLCCCSCSVIRQDTVAEAVSSVRWWREKERERGDQFSPGQTKTEQQWRPEHGFPYRVCRSTRDASENTHFETHTSSSKGTSCKVHTLTRSHTEWALSMGRLLSHTKSHSQLHSQSHAATAQTDN